MTKRTRPDRSASGAVTRSSTYRTIRKAWLRTAGSTCYICQQTVHHGAPNTDPLQATVDHVVEVDRRTVNPLDTRFWRMACRSCNSMRGNTYRERRDDPPPAVRRRW